VFARLLAAFCLINLAVVPCRAESHDPANSELVLYLRSDLPQSLHTVDIMKSEVASLMQSAGYRVVWRDAQNKPDSTAANLVVVHLQGACAVPAGSSVSDGPAADTRTLAFTAVSDDVVLPFSTINCSALSRVVWPSLAPEPGARRDFLYGRAMARLLAHELYHILANTRDHERDGIAKSHFTFTDLLTERFAFEHTTLAKLQRPAPEAVSEAVADAPSGR
jgi:hypothetical protein